MEPVKAAKDAFVEQVGFFVEPGSGGFQQSTAMVAGENSMLQPAVLAFFPVPPEQTNEQLSDSATKDLAKCCSKGVLRNERCEATTLVKRFHSRAQKLPGSETHEAMWERYESKAKVHQVRNMTSRSCV